MTEWVHKHRLCAQTKTRKRGRWEKEMKCFRAGGRESKNIRRWRIANCGALGQIQTQAVRRIRQARVNCLFAHRSLSTHAAGTLRARATRARHAKKSRDIFSIYVVMCKYPGTSSFSYKAGHDTANSSGQFTKSDWRKHKEVKKESFYEKHLCRIKTHITHTGTNTKKQGVCAHKQSQSAWEREEVSVFSRAGRVGEQSKRRWRSANCAAQVRCRGNARDQDTIHAYLRSSGQMPRKCERSRHESETRIYSTKPPTHTRKSREKIEWYKMSGARFKKI
jgi:hypothetical protein